MTADFAMQVKKNYFFFLLEYLYLIMWFIISYQNVALQMGIPLVSIDGMMITRAKRFVLECFACLALVKDMTKSFCPKCGNHSLLKVSCSFEADG